MTETDKKSAESILSILTPKVQGQLDDTVEKLGSNNDFAEKLSRLPVFKDMTDLTKLAKEENTIQNTKEMVGKIKAIEDKVIAMAVKMENPKKPFKSAKSVTEVVSRSIRKFSKAGIWDKFINGEIGSNAQLVMATGLYKQGKGVMLRKGPSAQATLNAADIPMSDTTSVIPIGTGTPFQLTEFRPGLIEPTRRELCMMELVNVSRSLAEFMVWIEKQYIYPGSASAVAEGASQAAMYSSFRLVENSTQFTEFTTNFNVTKRMMSDVNAIETHIFKEIIETLQLKFDNQILNGTGLNNQLNGIINQAYAFQNPATPWSVSSANTFDALKAMIYQIKTNGFLPSAGAELTEIYTPTDIVINPIDSGKMEAVKDTLNRYVLDQITYPADKSIPRIAGLRITENIVIPVGSVLVMDAKKAEAIIREDVMVVMGYSGTDFRDNLITIKGDMRCGFYIPTIHQRAFVMDTIANVIQQIAA